METIVKTFAKSASLALGLCLSVYASVGLAQESGDRQTPRSTCMAIAQNPPTLAPASTGQQFAQASQLPKVDIRYVGHSTFRIEGPDTTTIATDYTGVAGKGDLPEVVTMNHAHVTHFTILPDPKIPHVLRGWGKDGEPAKHFLEVGETVIRNVTTDINSQFAGYEPDGNSIFIFEMAGLCIGHLGHLHHLLTDAHYAQIGRIDILMVPVDGGYTMNLQDMIKVIRRLNASVVLPMHWFGSWSLGNFLADIRQGLPVEVRNESAMEISLNTLPAQPTVIVLQPETSLGTNFD